ncbi:conserved hypothetical protein [Treponema primitia ZAS-2]|uniref:DUF327 family protein n=1 Tax=Treponema primitia (strain ATCC BAA-887 / DSM 12427 / ZAS-2) TaxID=545694 RepID=F5YNH4_TREPZ|nr:YaaR family protein [Treponema primitia]AEF85351.1 conserved hypothetical protein [Treponema primitia ZAS-2]
MDKIELPSNIPLFNPAAYAQTRKPGDKAIKGTKKSAFSRLLEGTETREAEDLEASAALDSLAPSEEVLQELLDGVHSAGDDLRLRPLGEEIAQYKRAVRRFLRYVVANGYDIEAQIGIPNYLKPGFKGERGTSESKEAKRHHVIRVVDEKLEQLAAGILAGQVDQLGLLARLDEITGLLVDLVQ